MKKITEPQQDNKNRLRSLQCGPSGSNKNVDIKFYRIPPMAMQHYHLSLYQQRVVTNVVFKIMCFEIYSYYLFLFKTFLCNISAISWGDIT